MNYFSSLAKRTFLTGILAATLCGTGAYAQTDPVVLNFQNNTGVSDSQIYIQFLGGQAVSGNYFDSVTGSNVALQQNTSYSLAQLQTSTLDLSQYSGRIYVNYGTTGLASLGTDNGGYTPAAANPLDANYNTRYQYFEMTVAPNGGGVGSQFYGDLSYIDFTAMSMNLQAYTTGTGSINLGVTNGNQVTQNTQILVNATSATAVSPGLAILPSGASSTLPNTTFARVISPQFSSTTTYPSFTPYLTYLATGEKSGGSLTFTGTSTATTFTALPTMSMPTVTGSAVSVNIAGTFVGTGGQPSGSTTTQAQTYDFKGTFDASGGLLLTPLSDSGNGDAAWIANQGAGVGSTTYVYIPYSQLNGQDGIYGNNPSYYFYTSLNGTLTLTGTTMGITNDVYGRAVGDVLAGLSFGYVGSTQTFTTASGTVQLGQMPSSTWWASGQSQPGTTVVPSLTSPTGTLSVLWDQTPASQKLYFGATQTGTTTFYNTYAASLAPLTPGYGFPLQDRLGDNLLTYNTATASGTNTTLVLTLNPDGTMPIKTGIWTTGSGTWTSASNWNVNTTGSFVPGGGVPVAGATAQFTGTSPTDVYTVDTGTDQHVGGIDFNYNAGTFTIANNTIYLSGDVVNSSTHNQTILSNIALNSNSTVAAAWGDITLGGSITLGDTSGAHTMTIGGAHNTLISGNIGDGPVAGGAMVKTGSGTLTLNGNNSFTGGLSHQGGTLILGTNTAAGTGTFTLGSSTGSLTVLQSSGGNLALNNDISLTGDTTISGTGGFKFNGQTTLTETGTLVNVYGESNSVNVEFAGGIGQLNTTGTAGVAFTKSGTGTTVFSGSTANTFTGGLNVNQGTVVLNKAANTAAYGGDLTIGTGLGSANSAIVQVQSNNELPAAQGIFINTDGQLIMQATGTATNLTMAGGSVTGAGTLFLYNPTGTSTNVNFTGVGNAAATISSNLDLSGTNVTFNIAKTSANVGLNISGNLTGGGIGETTEITKNGTGVLELSGTNTISGTLEITVSGGVLKTTSLTNADVTLNAGAFASTTGTVQVQNLTVNTGAFILGLGTGSQSDNVEIKQLLAVNDSPTFFFTNAGFNSGNGTFTLLTIDPTGTFSGTLNPSQLQFASVGIAGLTGTFQLVDGGKELQFVGQAGVTGTWNAGGGNWTTNTNWVGSNVPAPGADLYFTNASGGTIATDANQTTGAITFNAGSGSYTINSNTITLGGDLTNNSTTTQTIGSNLTLNYYRSIVANNGAINVTGDIALSNSGALPGILTFAGAQNITVGGVISDGTYLTPDGTSAFFTNTNFGGGIVKDGTGVLTLNGSNTFSGGVTIASGTLVAATSAQVSLNGTYTSDALGNQSINPGTNVITFAGGTLQTTASGTFGQFRTIDLQSDGTIDTDGNTLTVESVISGSGGLIKTGLGSLVLNQTGTPVNTFTGRTTVNQGSLVLGYVQAINGDLTVNSGAELSFGVTLPAGATFANKLTLGGTMLASGNAVNWGGHITTSGTNATIEVDSNAVLGLTGSVTVGNGTALAITGTGVPQINFSGILDGTGTITQSGQTIVNLSGTNTNFGGTYNVQQGLLNVSQQYALGESGSASLSVSNGAALHFTNTGDMTVALNTVTISGSGNDSNGVLETMNAGTTTLEGDITLTGSATIGSAGGQLALSGSLNVGSNTLTVGSRAAATIINSDITGSGTFETSDLSGVVLNGNNSAYSGDIYVNGGNFVSAGSAGALGTGTVSVNAAGTLVLSANAAGSLTGGVTVNAGTVNFAAGSGTTLLGSNGILVNTDGINTLNGNLNFAGGAILGVMSGSQLTLGGTININGALIFQGGGTLGLAGAVAGSGAQINVNNGILASGGGAVADLSSLSINLLSSTGTTVSAINPGGINNIQQLTVNNVLFNATGSTSHLLMDLGASTSDEIITTGSPGGSATTLSFDFNDFGASTSGGTYTVFHSDNAQGLNGVGAMDLGYKLNGALSMMGLSGTFVLANNNQDLDFVLSTSAPTFVSTGSGSWSSSSNWSTGSTPISGSGVAFNISGTGTGTIDTQQNRIVGGIEFVSGSQSTTIVNNTLGTYGRIINNSTNIQTVSSNIILVGDTTVHANTGDLAFTGAIDFGNYSGTPILTVTGTANTSISGGISSLGSGVTGTLVKSGTGKLHLTGANTFLGTTQITGGNLIMDGTSVVGDNYAVFAGGTLSGTGTISGQVLLKGGTIAPGHSPGTMNTGSETWAAGSSYNWAVHDATGAAGTGYSTLNITGVLDLSALTNASLTLNLTSLSAVDPDVNGLALNFDSTQSYSWILASTTGGILDFSAADFAFNASMFTGANPSGFSVAVVGDNLVLDYNGAAVPEPSTWALLAMSCLGLFLMVRRGRAKKVS